MTLGSISNDLITPFIKEEYDELYLITNHSLMFRDPSDTDN